MQLNTRVTEVNPEPMSQLESAHNEVKLTIGQCFQQVAALKARLEPVVVGRLVDAAAKASITLPRPSGALRLKRSTATTES